MKDILRPLAIGMRNLIPALAVWAVATTITLLLWWGLRSHEDRLLERLILAESRQLEATASRAIEARGLEMLRMARRWEGVATPRQTEWAEDARHMSENDALFRAFEWREADLTPRWQTPLPASGATGDLAPQFEDLRLSALAPGLTSDAYHVSASFLGPDGRRQVLIAAPLQQGGRRVGLVAGVIRVRDLADSLALPDMVRGLQISIREGTVHVYGPEPSEWFETWRMFDSAPVRVGDLRWSLDFWPTGERLDRLRSLWPPLTLVVGLLAALGAGYSTYTRRR